MTYISVSEALNTKSAGNFKNDKDEHCNVSYYYQSGKKHYQVIFAKPYECASRPAITSTSEKKILKLLNDENFILI